MKFFEAGDVSVKEILLKNKNTSASINPSDQVVTIDIYEDLNSPSLYAEIKMQDRIGLLTNFPIIGEEELQITFSTPGFPYPTTYKFNTFAVVDVQQDMTSKGYSYTIRCTSKEQIIQGNINITQSYNESIDEIVRNILVRYCNTDKVIDVDTSKGNETVVVPRLTPFTTIDMLRQRAVHPRFISSTFVFFENQDGFNFKCIEQLMADGKKKIGSKKFYYFQGLQKDNNTEVLSFRSIIEYENIARTDVANIVQSGGLKNQVKTFDLFTKNVEQRDFDMSQSFQSIVPMDNKNSLNVSDNTVKDFSKKNTYNFFIAKDSNRKQNFLDEMLGPRQAFKTIFNSNFVRVYVPGDSSIKAGDVIELNLPEASGITGPKKVDPNVSGNYLVTRLRHNITTTGKPKHYLSMDCNKMGLL